VLSQERELLGCVTELPKFWLEPTASEHLAQMACHYDSRVRCGRG
jgi:hypothetical protein